MLVKVQLKICPIVIESEKYGNVGHKKKQIEEGWRMVVRGQLKKYSIIIVTESQKYGNAGHKK